ncbi:MAG: methyltransferase domain-containing protein [Aquificae bacterium]|nr:methyltransferase domain-containing protein [Aquificota bacterium]
MAKRRKGFKDLKPTTGLVKNALFNILGDLSGLEFLDLFAGTGQIGLEAERRGARVSFVEKHKKRAEDIKRKTKGRVYAGDAVRVLTRLGTFDVIFADPPYDYRNYRQLLEEAARHLNEGGLLVVEHFKKVDLEPLTPEGLEFEEARTYGDTVLSFFRRVGDLK